jgi:hypothetical protein
MPYSLSLLGGYWYVVVAANGSPVRGTMYESASEAKDVFLKSYQKETGISVGWEYFSGRRGYSIKRVRVAEMVKD